MKNFSRIAIIAIGLGGAVIGSAAPVELLVKYKPGASPKLVNALLGAKTLLDVPEIGWQKVRLPATMTMDRAERLLKSNVGVAKIEIDRPRFKRDITPNDPLYARQYQHPQINMAAAWAYSLGSREVQIAIIDGGVRATHEDLRDQINSADAYNFSENVPGFGIVDDHGTHVAGDAAATGNNGKGGLGTAWNVTILPLCIFPNSFASTSAAAIRYAANKGAKVINMSYGSPFPSSMENDAVQYANDKDVVLVAAAGNENSSELGYPASFDNVLAVGSTDRGSGKSSFSNFGPRVDVAAPGGNVLSTLAGSDADYGLESGTSMASPVAAGAVALMRAYAPDLPNDEIVNTLKLTAVQGRDRFTAFGEINVGEAMRNLQVPTVYDDGPADAATFNNEGTLINPMGDAGLDAAKLTNVDDYTFDVTSVYRPGQGSMAAFASGFSVPTNDPGNLVSARLQMDMRAETRVTALLFLLNKNTGKYDLINSFGLSQAVRNIDAKLPVVAFDNYVSNGSIRVLVRTILPVRLGSSGVSFRTSLDHMRLRLVYLKPRG